mmetsp:Transcript_96616/g.256762  ORF Transcript_96616/g.256762 Transcript_96616/m.256762 type:complete len:225 (+) Transcript_96616:256-930(+)
MHPPVGGRHPHRGGLRGEVCDGGCAGCRRPAPGRRQGRARLHPLRRLLVVRLHAKVHPPVGARHPQRDTAQGRVLAAGPARRRPRGGLRAGGGAARGRGRRRARLQAVRGLPLVRGRGVVRAAVGAGAGQPGGLRGRVLAGPASRVERGATRRRRGPARLPPFCRLQVVRGHVVLHPAVGARAGNSRGLREQVPAEAARPGGHAPRRRRRGRARLPSFRRLPLV